MKTRRTTLLKFIMCGLMLVGGALTSSSCAQNRKSLPPKNDIQTALEKEFFVHGDPLQIVSGATFRTSSFVTAANYTEFDGFMLTTKLVFSKKTSKSKKTHTPPPKTTEDLEAISEELAAADEEQVPDVFSFLPNSLTKNENGEVTTVEYTNANQTTRLFFVRNDVNGTLELATKVQIDGKMLATRTLHYSLAEDQNMISFLLYDVESDALIALFFARPIPAYTVTREIMGDPQYFYFGGPGTKIRWNNSKPVEISICGSNELFHPSRRERLDLAALYDLALQEWQEAIGTSNLQLLLKLIPKDYPPFSDLNTHCIYLINDYLVTEDSTSLTPAETFSFYNGFFDLQHAFTMIWSKEYTAKNKKSFYALFESHEGYRILIHELGHLLGLDHLPAKSATPSVMSYKQDINSLTEYDKKAIQHLYSND